MPANDYRDLYLEVVHKLAQLSPYKKAVAIARDNRIVFTMVVGLGNTGDINAEALKYNVQNLEETQLYLSGDYDWKQIQALVEGAGYKEVIQ